MRFVRMGTGQVGGDPTLMQEIGLSKHIATDIRAELGKAFNAFVQDKDADKLWRQIKATAMKMPALAQFDAVRQWLEQPVVAVSDKAAPPKSTNSHQARRDTPKTKPVFKTPRGCAVRPAYCLPRHGRSSWLQGLLRGPWG